MLLFNAHDNLMRQALLFSPGEETEAQGSYLSNLAKVMLPGQNQGFQPRQSCCRTPAIEDSALHKERGFLHIAGGRLKATGKLWLEHVTLVGGKLPWGGENSVR